MALGVQAVVVPVGEELFNVASMPMNAHCNVADSGGVAY
jgi:hypothetical protein